VSELPWLTKLDVIGLVVGGSALIILLVCMAVAAARKPE